jgi:hypothetical protein
VHAQDFGLQGFKASCVTWRALGGRPWWRSAC